MPLESSASGLESDLDVAYTKAKDDGAQGIDVIPGLAADVAAAVHNYMLQALVSTDVDVDTGQADTGGGTSQSPGTGTGTGFLS